MLNIYRLNRVNGLKSATVDMSDAQVTLTVQVSVPDETFVGIGTFPMIASAPITLSYSLPELAALPGFDSGAMMAVDAMKLVAGEPPHWLNVFVDTYVGRKSLRDYFYGANLNAPIRILVPSKRITSIRQCKWLFCMADAASLLEVNDTVTELSSAAEFEAAQFRPVISGPATIAAGGAESFVIQLRSSEGEDMPLPADIYLEATAGVLNRARVPLSSAGEGSFEVSASGLQAGERIKLKAGFRYFPGAFEKIVEVV